MSIYSNKLTTVDTTFLSEQDKIVAERWNNYVKSQPGYNNPTLHYDGGYYGGNSIHHTTHNWGRFSNGTPFFKSSYLG